MFSDMHYLLLYPALLSIGTNGLVIGAVLLSVPLYFDGSYVDGAPPFVVFIFDTTRLNSGFALWRLNSELQPDGLIRPCKVIKDLYPVDGDQCRKGNQEHGYAQKPDECTFQTEEPEVP